MAMLVHLAPEKAIPAIRRGGIKTSKLHPRLGHESGVFAMPVVPNFYVSHQWLRELKRAGQRTLCGVYFRIPDDEEVVIGHYNQAHITTTAAEAVGIVFDSDDTEGYEVLVPRRIERSELHRVRHLPQVVGWRYRPDAHSAWYCGCPVCIPPGSIRGKLKRDQWEADQF